MTFRQHSRDSFRARSLKHTALALALMLGLLALATRAAASGFSLPSVGPTSTGVTTTDPVSVHNNPAGLGFAKRARLIVGGDLVLGDIRYTRERRATYQTSDSLDFSLPIDPLLVDSSKTGKDVSVSSHPAGVVPAMFAEIPLPTLPLVAGFGVYVPYAAKVKFPKSGPQRYQLVEATLGTAFFTPSIAWRPLERLSVGAGVSYVLGFASLSKTQDLATLSDLGGALARAPINQSNDFGNNADPAVRELDTLSRPFVFKEGRAHGVTFNAGITAEALTNLWIAASYEHPSDLAFRGKFTLDMNDPFFTHDLASQGLAYPPLVRGKASLSFTLPRVARLGVRYLFGKVIDGEPRSSVALEGTYTGWSSVDAFDVRVKSKDLAQPKLGLPSSTRFELARNWHDTFGGVLRGTHKASSALTLWGSFGCDSAASPDKTIDVASPDGVRLSVAGGLSQRIVGELRLILDAHVQTMLERKVVGSDHDLGNGTYGMRLFSLGAWADYSF